jgi:hypothetical protein
MTATAGLVAGQGASAREGLLRLIDDLRRAGFDEGLVRRIQREHPMVRPFVPRVLSRGTPPRRAKGSLEAQLARALVLSPAEFEQVMAVHARWLQTHHGPFRWRLFTALHGDERLTFTAHRTAEQPGDVSRRDLRALNLPGRDLRALRLVGAVLDDLDVRGVVLSHAMARNASAVNVCFDGADLSHADFSRATLRGSTFRHARCIGTRFDQCDLTGCDFTGAVTDGVSLSNAVGLWGTTGLTPGPCAFVKAGAAPPCPVERVGPDRYQHPSGARWEVELVTSDGVTELITRSLVPGFGPRTSRVCLRSQATALDEWRRQLREQAGRGFRRSP